MNLNETIWSDFKISDIFPKIEYGKNSYAIDLEDGHDCIYVGAKKDENGFMKWCKKDESLISKGNCIVFIVDGKGSVGYCNYMDRDFIATANLKLGYCKELNKYTGLFIATIASKERFRYSFGRKWKKFVKDTIIRLPATKNKEGKYIPDWQFMEDFIKTLHYKPITTKNIKEKISLLTTDWKDFLLNDYFEIFAGIYHYPDEYEEGTTPYYSASNSNNGISCYIDLLPEFKGNCIVTGKIGCTAFYAPKDFCATSDVNIFKPKFKMSQAVGLFIVTIINFGENYKWAYGRQCRIGNSKEIVVKLPAVLNKNKYEPDWDFMENYIKSLPYGDRI
ncbi:MAG: restriction endonuclease subunit S [Treponema sp.]|nr:restriction endonuclease subunit S [Treponema sp.]